MRKRFAIISILVTAALIVTVYATAGTAADPFVTLSHLKQIFSSKITVQLDAKSASLKQYGETAIDDAKAGLDGVVQQYFNKAVADKVADKVAQRVMGSSSLSIGGMRKVALEKGDRIVGQLGTMIMLDSGEAKFYGNANAAVLNLTAGGVRSSGTAAGISNYYMLTADDGSGIIVISATAQAYVRDGARVIKAYAPQYQAMAEVLNRMGLFLGTSNGFELDRPPTRQEALIMLVRLLGEESAALGHTGTSTFADLTGWADGQKYIVYSHNKGYTNGESATVFAQYKYATPEMYLTFVLRALGFSDAAGDFIWNTTSKDLAVNLGLLTKDDLDEIAAGGLMRDHVVMISYNALGAPLKGGGGVTLAQKLVAAGVITQEMADLAQR